MTLTLIPPSGAPIGCNSTIELNVERIDYSINNELIHERTGTKEGRVVQVISGEIQMNITGYCIAENGNTVIENTQILECIANNWNAATSPSQTLSYPKINWLIGNEYMLIHNLTFIDNAESGENRIDYLLTLYIDTRS